MKIFDTILWLFFMKIFDMLRYDFSPIKLLYRSYYTFFYYFWWYFSTYDTTFFHENFRHTILWLFFMNIFDMLRYDFFPIKLLYRSYYTFFHYFWRFFSTYYTIFFFIKSFDILYYDFFMKDFRHATVWPFPHKIAL